MSKKDYTKFSNQKETAVVEPEVTAVEEAVVEEPVIKEVIGVVVDCVKLNVRAKPNGDADVIGTVNASVDVIVDEKNSTKDFYKVCTAAGLEGYCMKKYIKIVP